MDGARLGALTTFFFLITCFAPVQGQNIGMEASDAARKIGCVAKNIYPLPDAQGAKRYQVTCAQDKPAPMAMVNCPGRGACRAQALRQTR